MATSKAPIETHHHIVPVRSYAYVLVALLILMASTVWIAEYNIPSVGPIAGTVINQAIALAIAIAKATLVVMFFMGVRWSTQLTKFWALIGFAWLSFFTIMAGDYSMRKFETVQGWEKSGEFALPREVGATEGQKLPPNEINIHPRQSDEGF